jgi:hypothetical protein
MVSPNYRIFSAMQHLAAELARRYRAIDVQYRTTPGKPGG